MSQYGSPSRELQFRKRFDNRSAPENTGVVVQPNAPGLIVNDAPSNGAILFGELYRALGLLDTTAGQVDRGRQIDKAMQDEKLRDLDRATADAYREQAFMDRQDAITARELDRVDAETDRNNTVLTNVGVQHGNRLLPGLFAGIEDGSINVSGHPETDVPALVAAHTEGMDVPQAEGFTRAVTAPLLRAAFERRGRDVEQARKDIIDNVAAGFAALPPDQFQSVKDSMSGVMKTADIDIALLDAMKVGALNGRTREDVDAMGALLSKAYPEETTRVDLQLTLNENRAAKVDAIKAKEDLNLLILNKAPGPVIEAQARAAANVIGADDAQSIIDGAIHRSQAAMSESLGSAINAGDISTEAELDKALTFVSPDPLAHNHIPAATVRTLRNQFRENKMEAKRESDVNRVLQDGGGVLTSEHDKAITKAVGPEGLGFIDNKGGIVNPAGLAVSLVKTQTTPPQVRQVIMGNLLGYDQALQAEAMKTVGLLARSNSNAWTELYSGAGSKPEQLAVIAAQIEFDTSGGNIDPAAVARLNETVRALRENPELAKRQTNEELDLAAGAVGEGVGKSVRKMVLDHHAWTDDWWFDPSVADYADQAAASADKAVSDYFTVARLVMPTEKAMLHAKEYAAKVVDRDYQFPRWNDTIHTTPAYTPDGTPINPKHVWTDTSEDEASLDLAAWLTANKSPFKKADVQSLRYYRGPDGATGWAFVLNEITGDVLTGDGGVVPLWVPKAQEPTSIPSRNMKFTDNTDSAFLPRR